jgi:hypothetical protein
MAQTQVLDLKPALRLKPVEDQSKRSAEAGQASQWRMRRFPVILPTLRGRNFREGQLTGLLAFARFLWGIYEFAMHSPFLRSMQSGGAMSRRMDISRMFV